MGFKTAGKVLEEEIAHLKKRIKRVEDEAARVAAQNGGGNGEAGKSARAEAFEAQVAYLREELGRKEKEYELRKGDLSARQPDMPGGTRTWGNRAI